MNHGWPAGTTRWNREPCAHKWNQGSLEEGVDELTRQLHGPTLAVTASRHRRRLRVERSRLDDPPVVVTVVRGGVQSAPKALSQFSAIFPVAGSQVGSRGAYIQAALDDMSRFLLSQSTVSATLCIVVNGRRDEVMSIDWIDAAWEAVILIQLSGQDKIDAVNTGIEWARTAGFQSLCVVDNDIRIPVRTLDAMTSRFVETAGLLPVTCDKYPLVPTDATMFQRSYSRFALVLLEHKLIQNWRPTGSLYFLNLNQFDRFPSGCNEGDYLYLRGFHHTWEKVYSEYPRELNTELARRGRLAAASARLDFEREMQSPEAFVDWFAHGPTQDLVRQAGAQKGMLLFGSALGLGVLEL